MRKIILILFFSFISSKTFLRPEILSEDLDDDIALEKSGFGGIPRSISIPKTVTPRPSIPRSNLRVNTAHVRVNPKPSKTKPIPNRVNPNPIKTKKTSIRDNQIPVQKKQAIIDIRPIKMIPSTVKPIIGGKN